MEGLLGEGGTATVHLARDLETSQLVVVKRMKPEIAAQPELERRFVLEGEALQRIDHPQVVRALGVEEPAGEPPLLILEALAGETLGSLLKREGACSPELAVRLLKDACAALDAVHTAGVIHRDIKPDNIFLVGPLGAPTDVKVLDFGMARFADEQADEHSTSILGTAQYMAPEQILVEPVDARTDVYALGVMMFRMLTGHLPFDAKDKKDLLRHQLFSPVPPVTWLTDDLNPELVTLIRRATRKSPEMRPANMLELLDALTEIEDAGPTSSSPESMEWSEFESDVYQPRTERGRQAAEILAQGFGAYYRPHSPAGLEPRADAVADPASEGPAPVGEAPAPRTR